MLVQDSIDMLALFITKNDAIDLPYRLRSALLRHIDAAQLNISRYLKTEDSKRAHGGYLQGQQAVFATFYGKHDRTVEAEALFAAVLSQQTRYLGPMDIAVLATTNNLASLYLRLQRYEQAEVLLRRVLLGKEQHFPPNDLRIANTINELGIVCSQLGRCDEARTLYLRNLNVFLQNQNTSVNNLKIVYSNLGEVAMRQGKLAEAGKWFEKAMGQGRNGQSTCQVVHQTGNENPLDEIDCQILLNKGRLLHCAGMFDMAHATYERARQGLVMLLGPKHSQVIAVEKELAFMIPLETSDLSIDEKERLRFSQDCDQNPSIKGQCINWGRAAQMQQSQLLHFERRMQQLGGLLDSRTDYQSPSVSLDPNRPSTTNQLLMPQQAHPFVLTRKNEDKVHNPSAISQLQMPQQAHPFIPTHEGGSDVFMGHAP